MVVAYEEKYEKEWDDFVLGESINGNFLQTRKFYNYHPKDRFKDASIMFYKDNSIAAVIPANEINAGKILLAHQGSTFGGIVIGKDYANTTDYNWIFQEMMEYFDKKEYEVVELRMHNWLYSPCEKHHELLDYYFQQYGFTCRSEVGFYVDLQNIDDDYELQFEKLKRRKLNKARKQGLIFKKLSSDDDVTEFYDVLADNMCKFGITPPHSLNELLEFKNKRLSNETSFYGVFKGEVMIAGSMVFNFCNKKVFHTQYLASKHDYLSLCPNEFLYTNLIKSAKNEGFRFLSYGTSTLDHGNVYNESLGMYKEGFNTDTYLNRCYIWNRGR